MPNIDSRTQEESLQPLVAGAGRAGGKPDMVTIESSLPPQPTMLGYEEVEVGPTSNFVGNHMTQAAVDLVQYQLRRPDLEHERKKHLRYQQTYHPPKLIDRRDGASFKDHATMKAIEKYTWQDTGESVEICIDARLLCDWRMTTERNLSIENPELRVQRGGTEVTASFSVMRREDDDCGIEKRAASDYGIGNSATTYSLVLRALYDGVDAEASRISANGPRVNVLLRKLHPSCEWRRLLRCSQDDQMTIDDGPPRITDVGSGDAILQQQKNSSALAVYASGENGGLVKQRGPSDADLASMRRALIQQRVSKKPGDGLLLPQDFQFRSSPGGDLR